uniref:Hematopoietic cell-specific Lyn substrate 1 n=1 Tax=Poecilia reticulata TaxID=8081 RepID=A0A3P9QEK5_POERE
MWKSVVGHDVNVKVAAEGDDWETDPDFENDVSEQEQRWGAKSIEGSGRKEHISVAELRNRVAEEHEQVKQKDQTPKASYGYGGKFGVEKDRMDKVAMGHDYVAQVEQHSSQKDMAKGFGGKFGVQKDRVDKAALGYDYKAETEKHQSQKDYAAGFGGRYGVQTDRMDKSAAGFSDMDSPTSAYEKTQPVEASSAGAGKLKARFENMAKASDEENRKKVEEERARRQARESREREEAKRRQQVGKMAAPPSSNLTKMVSVNSSSFVLTSRFHLQGDELYEEPPDLPPRSDYLLEPADPPLPPRSAAVDEEEDGGDYEELSETPAPEPEGASPTRALQEEFLIRIFSPKHNFCSQKTAASTRTCRPARGQLQFMTMKEVRQADDEISFNPDDVITNIEMIDEGWWKGQCHGRTGLFPSAYVQLQ